MIFQQLSYCPLRIWILCSNQVDWFRSSVIGFQRFLQNKFFGKKSCGKVDLTSFEIFIELYNIVKTYDFAHSFIYTVQSFAVFQVIININHLPYCTFFLHYMTLFWKNLPYFSTQNCKYSTKNVRRQKFYCTPETHSTL